MFFKKIVTTRFLGSVSAVLFFGVLHVQASTIPNPLASSGVDNIFDFIQLVFDAVIIPIGGIVVALGIIWSGFLFVKAQGNPSQLEEAKRAFFWSFIGAMVLLGSWALAMGIKETVDRIRGTP